MAEDATASMVLGPCLDVEASEDALASTALAPEGAVTMGNTEATTSVEGSVTSTAAKLPMTKLRWMPRKGWSPR